MYCCLLCHLLPWPCLNKPKYFEYIFCVGKKKFFSSLNLVFINKVSKQSPGVSLIRKPAVSAFSLLIACIVRKLFHRNRFFFSLLVIGKKNNCFQDFLKILMNYCLTHQWQFNIDFFTAEPLPFSSKCIFIYIYMIYLLDPFIFPRS